MFASESIAGKPISPTSLETKARQFGVFSGVFLPSFLMMVGVILYLRLGWITAQVGLPSMVLIISLSALLMTLTSCSITAIVTNMKVRQGGVYYILSRLLGIEIGGAIGILMYFSQVITIALCVSGFSESLHHLLPGYSLETIELATLVGLLSLTFSSTDLTMKTQVFILIVLIGSYLSVLLGDPHSLPEQVAATTQYTKLSFWKAFAMFYPAMTGIEIGIAMSGDLKNPSRSIPLGILSAIACGFFIYLTLAVYLYFNVPTPALISNPMVVYDMAFSPDLVMAGIWGATLSSSIGGLLAAPRILQAMAKDGILPSFISKVSGKTKEPRAALVITTLLASVICYTISIDQILPLLTMICLITYCCLNLVAGFEEIMKNPSWHPRFRTHWSISITAAAVSLLVMLFVDSIFFCLGVSLIGIAGLWLGSRKIKGEWDDLRYGMIFFIIRVLIYRLSRWEANPKNWRPHILAIVRSPKAKKNLVFFANSLVQGNGLLTCSTIIPDYLGQEFWADSTKKVLGDYFKRKKIDCLIEAGSYPDEHTGTQNLIKAHGLGPISPNTLLIPFEDLPEKYLEMAELVMLGTANKKNILILNDESDEDSMVFTKRYSRGKEKKEMHLRWGKGIANNFEFCLAMACIMLSGKIWKKAKIIIKWEAKDEEAARHATKYLKRRFREFPYETEFRPIIENEPAHTVQADLEFISLRSPEEGESCEEYALWFHDFAAETKEMGNVVYYLPGEGMEFKKVFKR